MSGSLLVAVIFGELPIHSLSAAVSQIEEVLPKLVISLENWSELLSFQWKMTWFSRQFSAFAQALCFLVYSSLHLCLLFSVPLRPLVGLRPRARVHSFTMFAVSLSVLSKTQIQKAFSLHPGALSLWYSLPQSVYGIVRVPRNLDFLFYNCPVFVEFPWCVVNCLSILPVPFLACWFWSLLILRGSKLKNSFLKRRSAWRTEESNRRIILFL